MKNIFNDFAVKKVKLKLKFDFVELKSNQKKTPESALKWFRYCYNSLYLLSPIIFSAVSNIWCLLMSCYKRIWFAKP